MHNSTFFVDFAKQKGTLARITLGENSKKNDNCLSSIVHYNLQTSFLKDRLIFVVVAYLKLRISQNVYHTIVLFEVDSSCRKLGDRATRLEE